MIDFPFDAVPTQVSADHSRFVQRIRRRYVDELAHFAQVAPGLPRTAHIRDLIAHLQSQNRSLDSALRVARNLVMERLACLDVEAGAPMLDITASVTELAEVTTQLALEAAQAELDLKYGAPLDAQGQRIDMWVVGMGKLGGRELNVSSDIDLIYVYEDEGQTTGLEQGGTVRNRISAHEYFAQVARRLSTLIGDTTEDGFVFRVDLALRPNGNSGPSAVSMGMLEEYFLVQGREWERFAWLKSRIIAPERAMPRGAHHDRALALRDLVMPFVFRRYLDYGIFEGLRQLHRKIRDEAIRRAAGRPERANDVKLARGGIREIEFTVQLLQVVRGGQFPEIRTRSTLKALPRLAARGLISEENAQQLAAAYTFLRRIEHRIQFLDDQQTHVLPTEDRDLAWIADSLGIPHDTGAKTERTDCRPSTCKLLETLCNVREFVATEFDALLHDGRDPKDAPCRKCGPAPVAIDQPEFLQRMPESIRQSIGQFAAHPKVSMLSDAAKLRLSKLLIRAVDTAESATAAEGEKPAMNLGTIVHFTDWLTPLLRRDSYLALLDERPEVLNRLLRMLGLAKWSLQYLLRHPGVIDELADPRLLDGRFDRASYQKDLEDRHTAWTRAGQADEESLLDTLRRAHHAEVFRTLVRDVEGVITVEQVADDLSALADATLEVALQWAWSYLQERPGKQGRYAVGRQPHFAIIAYGKLGGKELGYGSDLDVVFLFDETQDATDAEDDPDAPSAIDAYLLFARKLVSWLTMRTSAGELFDIDTALRPNGNSGLLVTTFHSFDDYQRQRGSNTAWTWEHQALSRARWCAGDMALAERFEATRRSVLAAQRDPDALRTEVIAMRDRLREAHPTKADQFDIKHSRGGMIDVEFTVQYLVLTYSHAHPDLLDNVGNIALLQRAEKAGLLPASVGQAAGQAYRELRRIQHRARLNESSTKLEAESLASIERHREAVMQLWNVVFPGA